MLLAQLGEQLTDTEGVRGLDGETHTDAVRCMRHDLVACQIDHLIAHLRAAHLLKLHYVVHCDERASADATEDE